MRRRKTPLVIAGLALLALGLAFWPPSRPSVDGSEADAAQYGNKLSSLRQALSLGQTAGATLSEAEIDARLHQVLAGNRGAQSSQGLTVGLHRLDAEARDGHLAIFIDTRLVGIPLVFEARVAASPGGGEYPLVLRSLRVGHLPLVGPFRQLVGGRMRSMFRQVEPERSLIPRLEQVTYRDGAIDVVVIPRQG